MKIWTVKHSAFPRVMSGHPWVFSNELDHSPKGVEDGELVRLLDSQSRDLGVGFANSKSLIAFRFLHRGPAPEIGVEFFFRKFRQAVSERKVAGSSRWVFAEADLLPGLVVDRFLLPSNHQVLTVQINSAGMDRLKDLWMPALLKVACQTIPQEKTSLILAVDSQIREKEGIEVATGKELILDFMEKPPGLDWNSVPIVLAGPDGEPHVLKVNLLGGQKTGFFLDQRSNIKLLWNILQPSMTEEFQTGGRPLRILDLFSYVGQWSAQIARAAARVGVDAEVVCVDASQSALTQAAINVQDAGARVETKKLDLIEGLGDIPVGHFDVVVCDPPALIKQKKDIGPGTKAYEKVNRAALRRVRDKGYFVSCSCSGHMGATEFRELLASASSRQRLGLRLLGQGGHPPDHPQLPSFLQGSYLKCWVGRVDWNYFGSTVGSGESDS